MLQSIPNEYDRSRYLLVTLILANMGNLEINVVDDDNIQNGQKNGGREHLLERETSPVPNVTDHIHLKLLKLERHHQVIFYFLLNFLFFRYSRKNNVCWLEYPINLNFCQTIFLILLF